MSFHSFLLNPKGFFLELDHLFIPVLVKLSNFLNVSHFDFFLLVLMSFKDGLSPLLLKFDSDLG